MLQYTATGGTTRLFRGRRCPAALRAWLHSAWTSRKVKLDAANELVQNNKPVTSNGVSIIAYKATLTSYSCQLWRQQSTRWYQWTQQLLVGKTAASGHSYRATSCQASTPSPCLNKTAPHPDVLRLVTIELDCLNDPKLLPVGSCITPLHAKQAHQPLPEQDSASPLRAETDYN